MIEFRDFSFWYPDCETPVLRGINLQIDEGETVLIMGPSGSGKSTLLLAMNGVVPQLTGGTVKGRVLVNEQDTRTTSIAALASEVGLILQDPESQLTNLYVFDEIAFGPENLNLSEKEIYRRVENALRKTGLMQIRQRSVFALSGGQKQRVAIAAVLAMAPRILLLDNPTSNLDPVGAAETYQTIRDLRSSDDTFTIIIAEHRPDHIIDMADRLIVMDRGEIILDGPPRKLFHEEGLALRDKLGIFVPQITDLFLALMARGIDFPFVPLTLSEAMDQIASIKFSSKTSTRVDDTVLGTSKLVDQPAVKAEKVSYHYPNAVKAVDDVSLCIQRGEFICLVGQNGSGKTTLAKVMVGLLRPQSGEITLLGRSLEQIPMAELVGSVGYVFQYPEHQFITQNVYDEVAYSLRARGVDENEVAKRVGEMLSLFALQDLVHVSPFLLSKGQKRRLSVATMLISRPDLLILDEPMTGQDYRNIHNLLAILNDLRDQGTAIIDITHDMEHVASFADRVIGLHEGRVIFDGAPAVLFNAQEILQALSLEPPPAAVIARNLRSSGVDMPIDATTASRLIEALHFAGNPEEET